jgi:hypothetical protein
MLGSKYWTVAAVTGSSLRLRIVSAAVPPTPQREPVHMAAMQAELFVTSDKSDIHDLPFDFDVNIDVVEYSRIMRRVGVDGGSVTPVSAFNSSI